MKKLNKLKRKLAKTYIKCLRAYARGLIEKGGYLEHKSIELEIKLKDMERYNDA